jgi:hypothetical protein
MERRDLLLTGSALLVGLAGCSADSTTTSDADASPNTDSAQTTTEPETQTGTEADTPTETESETPTETESGTPTETDTPTPQASYQVKVQYDGEWTGSIAGDGSSRSVDGEGTETFDVKGDPFIVSANAQKQDDGSGTLTIQILEGGELVAEQTTSAAYGVAQITSEDGIQSSGGDTSNSASEGAFEVRVVYSGQWQGSISVGGSARSVEGSGDETIPLDGNPSVISANAQKNAADSEELTVQILKDGEVVKETSTTAEYGVAQVSYSNL